MEKHADEVLLYREEACIAIMKCGNMKIIQHEYSDKYGIKQSSAGIEIVFEKKCIVEVELK